MNEVASVLAPELENALNESQRVLEAYSIDSQREGSSPVTCDEHLLFQTLLELTTQVVYLKRRLADERDGID